MKETLDKFKIAEQQEGVQKNIESTVEVASDNEAVKLYNELKKRLLDINSWDKICGKPSAVFKLTDGEGETIHASPSIGNYIKIDIPGPGTIAGKGYDWVHVERLEEQNVGHEEVVFMMTVRPSNNPISKDDNVAHFFSDKATSNFVVSRKGNRITAAVYGRNEKPNIETTNLIDKARNAVVGTTASAGLSDPQWKALVDGILAIH